MINILKRMFNVFGWAFFIYDIKSIFLAFIIHLAIVFFLMLVVYFCFGFWATITAFIFMYLGGANIIMIQQIGKKNQDRQGVTKSINKIIENESEKTNSEPIQKESIST